MSIDPRRVLFMGIGSSPVCYYRIMLPAMQLKSDWIGVVGEPPKFFVSTGLVRDGTEMPNMLGEDYDIIVVQQPMGEGWLKLIDRLHEEGKKVLFEIDDYLHAIKDMQEHDFREKYQQQVLIEYERTMRACDGIIASTEYIAAKYKKFNPRVFVCQNGIDLRRYKLQRPSRDTVNIGWAGGTGHAKAVINWLVMTAQVMRSMENTCFVSIGQPFANDFVTLFGEDRAIAVPWAAVEQYPAAMTMMDIALAPAGTGGFFRGKSDLRWLEAGALGIPTIANPRVYKEIEDGVTGLHARNPQEVGAHLMTLIGSESYRGEIGENARSYIEEHRTIEKMALNWQRVFDEVAAG